MTPLLAVCERERGWLLQLVREFVLAESPSDEPAALGACGDLVARRMADAGAAVERLAPAAGAPHVLGRWEGTGPHVLLLGHFDTVWPVGQLERMPLREHEGRLYGPGVFDMKAGLGIGLLAVRALREISSGASARVSFLATADEETGSATSRAIIEDLARSSAAVLVLEPSLAGGAVKTARKGVGHFHVRVRGVAAHAGVDPAAGASAIHELAHQIRAIERLNDPASGRFVNVGVIRGGTRANVVAEDAAAEVDVRISRVADGPVIERELWALAARNPRVRIEIAGGINRPPMERTAGVARLFELARRAARDMGLELGEGSTGGGSDGNFTAALGVPTLDGLGALGEGPHALHEHVVINGLAPRAALVAGLLARL